MLTQTNKDYYFDMWEKDFYDVYAESRSLENSDFESIALGFFIAKGLDIDNSNAMYQYCITKNKF